MNLRPIPCRDYSGTSLFAYLPRPRGINAMLIHLYLAPAASGKTTYLVAQARALSANPPPRRASSCLRNCRCAPGSAVWPRRAARSACVGTFDTLYREILRAAGKSTSCSPNRSNTACCARSSPSLIAALRPPATGPASAQIVQSFVRNSRPAAFLPMPSPAPS